MMKKAKKTAQWFVMISMVATIHLLSGCKKDDDPSPRTIQIEKLSNTWKVNQVTNDSQDVTPQYSGFTLTVNSLNYTTQNGGNPWPASGTYDFKEGDLMALIRNDGTEITILEVSENTLVLSFNFNTVTGGRVSGVTGDFTFSLIK